MNNNLPDGCRDNDPNAPWNQRDEPTIKCPICGGEMLTVPDPFDECWECFDCGTKDIENVSLCTMCGDHRPKIVKSEKGYRAECPCGVSGQFEDNSEAALTRWNILNR
jgi:hypothetical protein